MKHAFFFALYLVAFDLFGQPVFFNHISQDDGLRNGNVRAVVKDYQGFIWIGTEDGLHRFDGYTMKIYRSIKGDSLSLGSNFILCLFEDSANNLWIGTLDGGLYRYNRKLDSFNHFNLPTRSDSIGRTAIRCIAEGKDSFLYVGSDNLSRAKIGNLNSMHFEKVPFPTDTMIADAGTRISSITQGLDSNLLISVNTQGLFCYNIKQQSLYPKELCTLEKNIQTVYVDKIRKLIWIGSGLNGLLIYNPATKNYLRVQAGHDSKTLRSNFVASIAGDATGNIWIATDNGLSMVPGQIDPLKEISITTYLPDKVNQTSIHGNIIKTVYVDDKDKVWVGTYYDGLNIYDRNSMNFGSLTIATENNGISGYGNVNALQEDDLGNLWIGLDGGGLYCLHGKFNATNDNSSFEHVTATHAIDKIKSMKIDGNQNLWLGTWGNGLWMLNTRSRVCEKIPLPAAEINTEIIALNTDQAYNLWIGTFDKGLFRYSLSTKQIEGVHNAVRNTNLIDRVNAICVDPVDNIWIGKEAGGLNFLKKGATVYENIQIDQLDPSTTVSSLYYDKNNILWIGVPSLGLVEYNPVTHGTVLYGEENGLVNSSIYAIQEDSLHRLWVSHNAGISVFDKDDLRFTNFTKANGLTASQFNRNSAVQRSNGQRVFGNILGMNFFKPEDYRKSNESFPIVFTRFLINNTEQVAGVGVLTENITTIQNIYLNHNQNSFSIGFASLNYNFSQATEYAYRLTGFNSEWQYAANQRLVSYTNLEPGEYSFEVRQVSKVADDKSKIFKLAITIVPAWWQTSWFKMSLGLLIVALALTIHRTRINFLIRQRKHLEGQVEARTRKLNDTNAVLQSRIDEINAINILLREHQNEILEKNNEIQAQNEELLAQNEQIYEQQEKLIQAREQLKEINSYLEKTVDERTEMLQRTIKDLNKTVFELDRFVYSASHDLSAPLKSIRGLVELIHIEKDPAKVFGYIDYIKMSVLKQEAVIKSMVDYARNTHVLVKSEKFNLKKLIDEVISELAFWSEASRMEYQNSVPENLELQTDRSRLKVVFHNLISNGIKYADTTKESSWMKFDCIREVTGWKIRITDNGIGIRKEYLEKVFNMYFRATELSKGSGLGLFIVKETLRKINASVAISSEYGRYTVFEVTLPDIVLEFNE